MGRLFPFWLLTPFIAIVLWELYTGRAHPRGPTVRRSDNPRAFWNVICGRLLFILIVSTIILMGVLHPTSLSPDSPDYPYRHPQPVPSKAKNFKLTRYRPNKKMRPPATFGQRGGLVSHELTSVVITPQAGGLPRISVG
jgi:hypothetical protein